jgi:hypothetical protein
VTAFARFPNMSAVLEVLVIMVVAVGGAVLLDYLIGRRHK